MRLNRLSLVNFRNYPRAEFDICGNHIVLLGKNGTGKTNFLEAIHYLSLSRSFRTTQDASMTGIGKDFFSVSGDTAENEIRHHVEITYSQVTGKKIFFDTHRIKAKELGNRMSVVVFHGDDMNLIRSAASSRRRYLDIVLSQTDPEYYHALAVYNHLMRQKKELLKKKIYR